MAGRNLVRDVPPLSEIARHCGVPAGHLSREFARWYGEPLRAFRRRKRLAQAARFLRDHNDSGVAEVAMRCGYRGPSAFISEFRRQYGMTPRAFRWGGA